MGIRDILCVLENREEHQVASLQNVLYPGADQVESLLGN
jgi:hypothetical protein